jgi:hypothetical protein
VRSNNSERLLSGAALIFALLLGWMRVRQQVYQPQAAKGGQKILSSLVEGLRFLGKTQVLLAATTLDLFAVLLGGTTTLLPIFARDIRQSWLQLLLPTVQQFTAWQEILLSAEVSKNNEQNYIYIISCNC